MFILPEDLQYRLNHAKDCLNQGKYQQAVEFLEHCIENNPEEVNYYWHLGLAYLLQEQEENAQATWFLVMSQGDESEIEQWTKTLLTILETEAQRQEQIGNIKLSWLIRGHIREIEPNLLNNLLHLIDLEIQLKYYEPERLEDWQIVENLENNSIEAVDSQLLLRIIPDILNFPFVVNIDFIDASLKYISDLDILISILKSTAIEMAYDHHKASYSVDLLKICIQLKPNDLELINCLYQFSYLTKDYAQVLQSAKDFLELAGTSELKAFAYYKLIYAQITCSAWSQAKEILPDYIASIQKMLASKPKYFEPMVRNCLQGIAYPLVYLQDNPLLSRQLQNQVSTLFQNFLPNWMSLSRNITNINRHYPRTLKIGYIAHTLRRHSVGWLSRWIVHYHNREQFQIYLYLVNQQEDDITQTWFREKVDFIYNFPHFPQKIADQIQQDEIDILVDLDSFSHAVTCQVLALKPAPIQVTWLGFDASGLPAIDYFIADPYVLPDNAQEYYQENIWRLPHCWVAVDGFETAVPTLRREHLDIPSDAIIFLSVQSVLKRHPDTIHLQMKILNSLPRSYFLIQGSGDEDELRKLFCTVAESEGVSAQRLRFLPTFSEEIYRANLSIADVVLDTYPFNGGTVTLDILWQGIPMVTKVGQQWASRNGYTLMTNAGLTEGIAWTDEEYVDWGIRLGTDEHLRQQISWKLQQSRKTAPLWNARQFTQEMENAYQQMWIKYLDTHPL